MLLSSISFRSSNVAGISQKKKRRRCLIITEIIFCRKVMLALTGPEELENPAFKWDKKRGLGGKNKNVQFYESFSYDGMDYALYDCVYMHKEGAPAPYIGKLVKIWETAEGLKKVKVHWFFRPSEISYYLKDAKVSENELFFASGDGKGLANLNPLEKATWIKLSWEQQMKTALDQGRLVLLLNLDPEYTSGEVEDIIWHTFSESCTARVLPHTAISDPYSGHAFVVFKSRGAANKVVDKLDEGCLMLPNQRPLVACYGDLPKLFGKQTAYVGHLQIDKVRRQMLRGTKEAVSTSHYSQNNTIEFEMAMDWCLLQSKSDKWWKTLYELHRKELKKHSDNFKSK